MRYRDRWQREVVLPEETWHDKILLDHGELLGNEASIERTLVDPDEVRFDRDHPDREVFSRRAALPPPDNDALLKVVVAFRIAPPNRRRGRIVTAYATGTVKPGERVRWKR